MSNNDSPRYLLLGEVLRPHGVRGELKTRVLTDYPERIGDMETVYLADNEQGDKAKPYAIEGVRMNQEYALIKLKGIDDRDQADRLRALYVMVAMDDAIPLEEGEFYLYQIIGLRIITEDGETFGTLTEVMETGANDVYIIDSERYGEVLIPAIESVILKTDIEAGTITVRLPEGLLPST
jgi:16S rRNA processing protein RimM